MKLTWLLFLVSTHLYAETVVINLKTESGASESELRTRGFQIATEKLIKDKMTSLGLDVVSYESAFDKKFLSWFSEVETKRRAEWKDKPNLEELIAEEKIKGRQSYAGWIKLLKQYSIKKFSADPVEVNKWELILDAQVDARLLALHHQRMLEEEKTFRKLLVRVNFSTQNFSWTDLELSGSQEFSQAVENEWLKWFESNSPQDVQEVMLCDEICQTALQAWEVHDEKAMKSFVSPELVGSLLLTVNINLEKDLIKSTHNETKMKYSGGVILHDLNTKRVLFWADLPKEVQGLKSADQKAFNSLLASYAYKYPLPQLTAAKNQVGRSVSLTNSMTVKLMNASHLGQVMKFLNWMRVKGVSIQAQGKLDSFSQSEARILFFFRGTENKFKALVSSSSELESELGRPLVVSELGSELIITLGEALKQ